MKQQALAASLVAGLFLSIAPASAAQGPAWLYLTPGTRAVLGTDGQDAPQAIVCPSAKAYSGEMSTCFDGAEGTIVVIDSTFPSGKCDEKTLVEIHSVSGKKWHGFAAISAMYPLIPPDTILKIKANDSSHLTISSDRKAAENSGTDLGASATIKIVAFEPTYEAREILATIVSGPHAGTRGWIDGANMTLPDGRPAVVPLCPAPQ
jgi:hypothetical protein